MELKLPVTDIAVTHEQRLAIYALYSENFRQFTDELRRQLADHPIIAKVPVAFEDICESVREALTEYMNYRLQYTDSGGKSAPMRPLSSIAATVLENFKGMWDPNFGGVVIRKALDTVDQAIDITLGLSLDTAHRA